MNQFLLLMRGSQTEFLSMTPDEQKRIISAHVAWSKLLSSKNVMVEGNGCSNETIKLWTEGQAIATQSQPYAGTSEEISGFYIIQTESEAEALMYAKQCPALGHGESVEVIPLGH